MPLTETMLMIRPRALVQHSPDEGLRDAERAFQVHVEDVVPVLLLHERKERVLDDARVVDEDVGAAELGAHAVGENLDLLELSDVGGDRDGFSPEAADLPGGLLGARQIAPARQDHPGAGCGELERDGPADSAGASRHDGRLHPERTISTDDRIAATVPAG